MLEYSIFAFNMQMDALAKAKILFAKFALKKLP